MRNDKRVIQNRTNKRLTFQFPHLPSDCCPWPPPPQHLPLPSEVHPALPGLQLAGRLIFSFLQPPLLLTPPPPVSFKQSNFPGARDHDFGKPCSGGPQPCAPGMSEAWFKKYDIPMVDISYTMSYIFLEYIQHNYYHCQLIALGGPSTCYHHFGEQVCQRSFFEPCNHCRVCWQVVVAICPIHYIYLYIKVFFYIRYCFHFVFFIWLCYWYDMLVAQSRLTV